MKKLFSLLLLTVTFMATAQVANDDCSNATVLQVNPNLTQTIQTSGTVAGATASPETNNCDGADDDDVWYQFTATNTSHQINIKNITGSTTDLNHVVYEGNDCSTLIQKYCSNPNNSTATGLIIGQTYKIRVYTAISTPGQTTTFDINVTTPPTAPVNDTCANATTLMVNPFGDTTITATSTLYQSTKTIALPSSNCGNENEDVWFKFIATGAKQKITTTNISGSIDGMNYAIYSGNCEALAVMTCLVPDNIIGSLVPGQTYYIRAYSWEGVSQAPSSFTISLSNLSPVNDSCTSPIALTPVATPYCSNGTPGSLVHTSPSTLTSSICGYNRNDLWYEFTATSTKHSIWLTNIVQPEGAIIQFTLFSGNCTGLTSLKCGSDTNPTYTSFVPGQTYKIRVYSTASGNVTFNICIGTLTGPPVNDNCSTAIPVLASTTSLCTQTVTGTISEATASAEPLTCTGTADDDIWYTFTATSPKHTISIKNIAGTTKQLNYTIYDSYPCEFSQFAEAFKKECGTNYSDLNNITSNYTIGQSYKIRIFSTTAITNQVISFNLCITTPDPPVVPPAPANDLCTNAITLPVNPTLEYTQQLNGTTEFATNSANTPFCNGLSTTDKDVWYQFTATSTTHLINCILPNGNIYDGVSLYNSNCNFLQGISCNQQIFRNLTVGQTYKIRIASGNPLAFTISVTTPPPPPVNDECVNALPIPVNPGLVVINSVPASINWATKSPQAICQNPQNFRDIWYTFTATSTTHHFVSESFFGFQYIALYTGNCNTLTEVLCLTSNVIFNNLVVGQNYKLRLYRHDSSGTPIYWFEDSSVAIVTPTIPANDHCANATVLAVNPSTGCSQATVGTFTSATESMGLPADAFATYLVDVWYQFTATHTSQSLYFSNVTGSHISRIEIYEGACGTLLKKGLFYPNSSSGSPEITGLTPGTTYKIRVLQQSENGDPYENSFEICLRAPYSPPANDQCSAAVILPINTGLVCETAVGGTLLGSSLSPENPITDGYYERDVWYTFTATATRHHINIGGSGYFRHILYSGSGCGALTHIYTKNNTNSIASNLTIGQTYTIRVLNSGYEKSEDANFTICIGTPVSAANDECSNAITLTVNPGEEVINFAEGSGQLALTETAGCGTKKDLWYKFTATSTLHYVDFQTTNTYNYSLTGIIMANDCSSIVCGTNVIALKNKYAPNLTIGQTYYIRLQLDLDIPGELNSFRLAITTPQAPAGDTCDNPIIIPVNPTQECDLTYTGNLIQATDSANIPGLCFASYPDLWVKFTATSSNHIIKLISNTEGSSNNKVYYSVFAGDDCNITENTCISYDYETPINCVIGETYRVRIRLRSTASYSSTPVELCVSTPTTCSNTEPFVNGYNEYVFDTEDSIPYQSGLSCIGSISNAKWFTLNITNPGDIEYTVSINKQFNPQGDPIGEVISDFSYIVWGPFSSAEQGCENLSAANILRCQSLSTYDYEPQICQFTIPNAQTGQYYIIIAGYIRPANYTANPYIKFEQTGGNAMSGNVPPPTGDTNQDFGPGQTLADIEMDDDVTWYDNPGEPLVVPFSDNDEEDEPEVPLPLTTPLVNGTTYYAAKTIYGIESFTRLAVTVNFVEEVPAPTGLAEQDFYAGETLADLVVNGENIKWYNNNEATVALPLNTLLTDGASYSASQTINGLESIQRLTVTVNEISVPSPTGEATQTFTAGETLYNLEVTGENIKWYANSSSAEVLPATTVLIDGTTYYASQTINGIESTQRLAVTVELITITPAPTGQSVQWFNEGETLANLEVTGENIKWYTDMSITTALPEETSLADGNTYYASQTVNNIESTDRLAVTAFLIAVTPAPTGDAEQTYTDGETLANLEVNGENIKWYADSFSTEELPISTPLADNTTYYASQTINEVESNERFAVTAHLILGNDDFIFNGLRYYPNPANNVLNIENTVEINSVSIVNALGQTVITKIVNNTNAQVDVSPLSKGVYFVTLNSGNARKTVKIIKE
ncbi:T9SS type A sorting domain-containing protein [Flavobacterium suzhouense]|uniref:T9SS type A sorting domain-containing protein n=1 Tax=Flavobacterium suzhouense TaxID=1529638 RepID=A0ABW5NRQ2_9FLAO